MCASYLYIFKNFSRDKCKRFYSKRGLDGRGRVYDIPLTRMRMTFLSVFIIWMNGTSVVSNLGEIISTGGTIMVTFFRTGGLRIVVHFETSGNWSLRILIVFLVAVAVIMRILPSKLLSSPEDNAMAGRKAETEPFLRPQLTTKKGKC